MQNSATETNETALVSARCEWLVSCSLYNDPKIYHYQRAPVSDPACPTPDVRSPMILNASSHSIMYKKPKSRAVIPEYAIPGLDCRYNT